MITYEELPYLTENKSVSDIQLLFEDMDDKRIIFREACKNYILENIPDGCTEDDPYGCDIEINLYNMLGESLVKQNIVEIYQNDVNELVFYTEDGDELPFDAIYDSELLQIIEQLVS